MSRHPCEDPDRVPAHLPVGNEITVRLRDRDGPLVTVISRDEWAPHGAARDYWQVTVNGEIPADSSDPGLHGVHAYPPFLAFLVQLHLRRAAERPLAPAVSR